MEVYMISPSYFNFVILQVSTSLIFKLLFSTPFGTNASGKCITTYFYLYQNLLKIIKSWVENLLTSYCHDYVWSLNHLIILRVMDLVVLYLFVFDLTNSLSVLFWMICYFACLLWPVEWFMLYWLAWVKNRY